MWYADENPSAIPKAQLDEEKNRRVAARLELRAYEKAVEEHKRQLAANSCCKEPPPVKPKVTKPRIWHQGSWVDRIPVGSREIKGWGTANLRGESAKLAAARQPTSCILDSRDRGDKFVEGGRMNLRRAGGEGLAIFNGDTELPQGFIVGPYAGGFMDAAAQSRHKTGPKDCTHYLTLCPGRTSLPPSISGIDGAVRHTTGKGRRYDIEYYLRNGVASLANSRPRSEANCKLIVEYTNYENAGGELYLDDEYCPRDVPLKQRVCSPPSTPSFILIAYLSLFYCPDCPHSSRIALLSCMHMF